MTFQIEEISSPTANFGGVLQPKPRKKGLRAKIVFAFLIVGFIPIVVGLFITYLNGTLRLRESMGENFQGLAMEAARKIDLVIESKIISKQHLTTTPEIRTSIDDSNQSYNGLSDQEINKKLAEMANRWETDQDPSFKEGILQKNMSSYLKRYMVTKSEKYIALFVTDEKGAIVASVNGFPRYNHSQEVWWKETYNEGIGKIHIGELYEYQSDRPESWAINIAVPVMDEKGEKVIGVLAVFHDVYRLVMPMITVTRFGKTGHAMLIDSDGKVLACPVMKTGSFLTDKTLVANVTSPTPRWILAMDDGHGGRDSIIGFAPLVKTSNITENSTGKSWHTLIRQNPKELYAPINSLLTLVSLSGIILTGFVAVVGIFLSKRLTKPIQDLQKGAETIAKGNLDVKVNIQTNDEIEQLAHEFNQMAQKLKESYSTLEQKVADRTKELSALNMIATTINQSLDIKEILENTLNKILEVMHLDAGAIRLWDASETKLVLQVSRGLPLDIIRRYQKIRAGDMIAGQAARSGYPVILQNAQRFSQLGIPLIELGFVSVISIPLKSKDKTVGTLTVAGRTVRSYNRQDLDLLNSIGHQLSIAIENATLYTETRAMVEQLKETDRFKSAFFSNMSHELRTPLTSIIGYSEFLLEQIGGELSAKQEEAISNIQSSGALLLEIINNLLDLSKIRARKMGLHFGEFSMRSLVLSCMKAVSPLASKKGQILESTIEERSLIINADEVKVKQALLNLLSNAIKFTHHGGTIFLDTRTSKLDGRHAVEVSVVDTGIGIKHEDLNKIFEEFRQVDTSYTREHGGTGLGLPIAKQFVEMHGGQIRVESQFGKGSRFTIVLPRQIDPENAEQENGLKPVSVTELNARVEKAPHRDDAMHTGRRG